MQSDSLPDSERRSRRTGKGKGCIRLYIACKFLVSAVAWHLLRLVTVMCRNCLTAGGPEDSEITRTLMWRKTTLL